jgi:hypothetical protein
LYNSDELEMSSIRNECSVLANMPVVCGTTTANTHATSKTTVSEQTKHIVHTRCEDTVGDV